MGLAPLADADQRDLLDDYIEAHVHGPLHLDRHVEALVLDPAHRGTRIEAAAAALPVPTESTTDSGLTSPSWSDIRPTVAPTPSMLAGPSPNMAGSTPASSVPLPAQPDSTTKPSNVSGTAPPASATPPDRCDERSPPCTARGGSVHRDASVSVEVGSEPAGEKPCVPLRRVGPRLTPAVAGRRTSMANEDVLVEVLHSKTGDHRVDMLDLKL